MGNVTSRLDDASALFLRDQDRFSISALTIATSRNRTLVRIAPNSFPASRYNARRDIGDDTPIDFIQDPDSTFSGGPPNFLLRLPNDEELTFTYTFTVRQQSNETTADGPHGSSGPAATDTHIAGLTYIFASKLKEIDSLVTREFHADPNLHRNPNVQLVGDYSTRGYPSVQYQWSWKWRPPKQIEDSGGGWRNTCSFVEYDQRAHKLNTLASFSFWVQNTARYQNSPQQRSPRLETISPQRLRVPSAQSIESRISAISDSDGGEGTYTVQPQSPTVEPIPEYGLGLVSSQLSANGAQDKLDVTCVGRPGEDVSATDDGPLFRATMKSLESKTGTLRTRMKRVLRTAEAAETAQTSCNDAVISFMEALKEASASNANAVRPALDHYFEKIAKEILTYERQNSIDLRRLIIEPISKLYNIDIKQAESKRRDFEEESKDYYAYVGRYLGQRSESMKEKKRIESDSKYQTKRRTFELKRFDYSSFMHDLHGGRKDQEVLSHLTRYAEAQAKGYLRTAKKVEEMTPQLEALCMEVNLADKEFQMQRTEREERRRVLEKNPRASTADPEFAAAALQATNSIDAPMASNRLSMFGSSPPSTSGWPMQPQNLNGALAPGSESQVPSRHASSKFKGIRDLEEKDPAEINSGPAQFRKEGLLWSLSRPGGHIDPKNLTKTAGWHKFWIVLDQGKLSEYVNWKDKLDLHMDPIDLRMASVREARSTERRFCFEVITPHYTRVYQAPSEEDMRSWIAAINNALQSAFESKSNATPSTSLPGTASPGGKNIAAVLTGKSSSFSGHRTGHSAIYAAKSPNRHATTGDKPNYLRSNSNDAHPSELLQRIRDADEGNKYCADCGSESKTEWVSINLGIVLCIECSGIHRSLGTHITKVRSLTLDTAAFTPDIIDLLLLIGNRVSNMIWEARLDRFLKPSPHSTRDQRLHFITAKYAEKAYVEPMALSPDDTLLTSIKRNEIQEVLHALANKANPNAQDRSRSTHAVFVALAAADPAMPGSSFTHTRGSSTSSTLPSTLAPPSFTSSTNTPERPGSRPGTPTTRKPFPVAELLLQNGADIPLQPAPIPLSRAAAQYLEFKAEQRNGKHLSAGPDHHGNHGGDVLAPLPSFGSSANSTIGPQLNFAGSMAPTTPTPAGNIGTGVAGGGKRQGWAGSSSGFVGGVKALGDSAGRRL